MGVPEHTGPVSRTTGSAAAPSSTCGRASDASTASVTATSAGSNSETGGGRNSVVPTPALSVATDPGGAASIASAVAWRPAAAGPPATPIVATPANATATAMYL